MNTPSLLPEALAIGPELTALRREIHAHPELGFETPQTVARIAGRLKAWGIDAIDTETVPGGLIAVVNGRGPGKTLGLRADIDALGIDERGAVPWKSTVAGRAHACGHDGHQTWLMGALRILAQTRRFSGRVVGFFQPAEELMIGAKAAIEAGMMEKYGFDEFFAAHDEPTLPAGHIGLRIGPQQASMDNFTVRIEGVGTHGARPYLGVDPIPAGSQIVSALQTIVSRKLNPVEPAVVSVCSINAGRLEVCNTIPGFLTLGGTVRTFSAEVRRQIPPLMEKLVSGIAQANGCTAEIAFTALSGPVVNERTCAERALETARELLPETAVHSNIDLLMGSDDFSLCMERVPGTMIRIGIADAGHSVPLHSPLFDFNDEVLPLAVSLFVRIAEKSLPLP